MIILSIHISQIIAEAGLIVLSHGAAAPVHIHIRGLLGRHGYNQLLLVVVILLMNLIHRNIRVIFHESGHSAFLYGFGRILGRNIPESNGQGLIGQLGNVS